MLNLKLKGESDPSVSIATGRRGADRQLLCHPSRMRRIFSIWCGLKMRASRAIQSKINSSACRAKSG